MTRRILHLGLRIAGIVVCLGLLLIAYALWWEPSSLRMARYSVPPGNWPKCDLTVALIADLHIGSPYIDIEYVQRLVERTNAEHPDLVLLLGDYDINGIKGGNKVDVGEWAPVLGQLEAPLGVHAVLGNHDWWNDEVRIAQAMRDAGIHVDDNDSEQINCGSEKLWLVGLGDTLTGNDDIRRALRRVPKDAPILAFAHEPDVVQQLKARSGLVVAGHTHGGQVRLPFLTDQVVDGPWLEGHYTVNYMDLFVTSGIGTSILPIRFRVPPEVAILQVSEKP